MLVETFLFLNFLGCDCDNNMDLGWLDDGSAGGEGQSRQCANDRRRVPCQRKRHETAAHVSQVRCLFIFRVMCSLHFSSTHTHTHTPIELPARCSICLEKTHRGGCACSLSLVTRVGRTTLLGNFSQTQNSTIVRPCRCGRFFNMTKHGLLLHTHRLFSSFTDAFHAEPAQPRGERVGTCHHVRRGTGS